jgi:hypothetical protein
LIALFRHDRETAWWLGAALLGPLLWLVASRPLGGAYAYARYLMVALPFALMLLGWLFVFCFRRLLGESARTDNLAVAAGTLLCVGIYLAGPLSLSRVNEGPFTNTYLALRALPAFDQPYTGTPEFYAALALDEEVTRVIEVPVLWSRAVLLYRNYFLRHGKETLLGRVGQRGEALSNGPYVWLGEPKLGEATGADYLILHRTPRAEVARYWQFVFAEAWPAVRRAGDDAFMVFPHHAPEAQLVSSDTKAVEEWLAGRFGQPVYDDRDIVVWRLSTGDSAPAALREPAVEAR